jgi:uroporphyrinogen decarboxylase
MNKIWDFYALKPDAPIYQTEFGYYVLDRWKAEGHIPKDASPENLAELFGFDPPGRFTLFNLGACDAPFSPAFEEKVLQDLGDYELVQDTAGRSVKYFKNRRSGFMPEFIDHPVKDIKSWEEQCAWRMDPLAPGRLPAIQKAVTEAKEAAAAGQAVVVDLTAGYMYLRSLMGPVDVMYLLYDNPDLIDRCMRAWFKVVDYVLAEYQKHVTIDELFFEEDICYNHGFLISEEMIRQFLFPYYQQVLANARSRQLDKTRPMHFQLDTDGFSDVAISLYREIGMDFLSPFEAASGCDVVRTGREYPDLLISGGFDKRIMMKGPEAIDREIDRIMPAMKKRGGYIPTCDHGVPEEVSFENYVHYRKRMLEYA